MSATPAAVLRSSIGRRCRQPADAWPVKLARVPCAARMRWRSATKPARRSGATAVSSTKAAGRSAPGAPMSSGRTARRSAAASARACRLLQPDDLGGAERAGQRAQPRQAGERLVVVSLVLHREHGGVVAVQQRRHAAVLGQVGSPAERREVEELDRRRPGLEDGDVGLERGAERREREGRAHPPRRARVEQHLELREERQRALGPGEQPAEVGRGSQQLPEVVAGGAAARLRIAGGDGLAVLLAHPRERRREPLPRRALHAGPQVVAGAGAERDGLAAGEHAGDAQDLVLALAVDDRAGAGRVVADHAADGGLVDRRRVGAELQAVRRRGRVERRLHHAGLHARPAPAGVDLEDPVQLEAVDDDAGAYRLPGDAGGGAARHDRQAGPRGDLRHDREVVRRTRPPRPPRAPRGSRRRRWSRASAGEESTETSPATSRRSCRAAARPSGESSGMR